MQVTFIRHGEAEHNVLFETQGESAYNNPMVKFSKLTPKGINQIKLRAKDSDISEFDLVITSSLPRALETAALIFDPTKVATIVVDEVRENNYYHECNQRRTRTEIQKMYPEFECSALMADEDSEFQKRKETTCFRACRFGDYLEKIRELNIKKIAVISHSDFIKYFTGLRYPIPNGGRVDIIV